MMRLTISLSLNCQLKTAEAEMLVGLPLVWVSMTLDTWRQRYERVKTALTVASIGFTAVKFGLGVA